MARRAPGSIDMRAAIAAMLWAAGEADKAEQEWSWACSKINSGQLRVRSCADILQDLSPLHFESHVVTVVRPW